MSALRCFGLEKLVDLIRRCSELDDCVAVLRNLSAKMRSRSLLGSLACGLRSMCPDLSEVIRSMYGDYIDVFDECDAIKGLANLALMASYRGGEICVEKQGVMGWYFEEGCVAIDVDGLVTALRSIAESRCDRRTRKIVSRIYKMVVGD